MTVVLVEIKYKSVLWSVNQVENWHTMHILETLKHFEFSFINIY